MPYVHVFASIADHLQTIISQGGYLLLFLFTILEGIPLFGMAVPGHVAIIIGGFMARIGTLNLAGVMIISIFGAILGDFFGFYLGRRYGMAFIERFRRYFFITDSHIEKARDLLAKHTGKALVIGRFTPATRSLMPFIVGTTHTPAKKFWFFNIIGGVSWVVVSVMLGYIFGAAYHAVAGYFGKVLVIAVLAAIIIIWGYKFVNSRFHIFKQYELFTLILNVLSLWAFAATIDKLMDRSFKLSFDVWVSGVMNGFNSTHPFWTSAAIWATNIGGTIVTASLGILIGIFLLFKKKWRSASIMILSIVSTAIVTGVLKELFNSPRPADALQNIANDPSFPSGHASMAAAFFMIVIYLSAPKIHSWVRRESMIVFCVIAVIAIGVTRLVLNVHWFSDVVGGWTLGVFLATASILLVRYVSAMIIKRQA